MIFNTANIIIFTCLFLINIVAIIFSERKRKFGIFPTQFFIALFLVLWISKVLVYFYVDRKVLDMQYGEIQVLGNFQSFTKGKISPAVSNALKTNHLKPVYYLQYIIRFTTVQSILAFLFSVYGLIAVYRRNEYYLKLIALHVLSMIFCIGMELNII